MKASKYHVVKFDVQKEKLVRGIYIDTNWEKTAYYPRKAECLCAPDKSPIKKGNLIFTERLAYPYSERRGTTFDEGGSVLMEDEIILYKQDEWKAYGDNIILRPIEKKQSALIEIVHENKWEENKAEVFIGNDKYKKGDIVTIPSWSDIPLEDYFMQEFGEALYRGKERHILELNGKLVNKRVKIKEDDNVVVKGGIVAPKTSKDNPINTGVVVDSDDEYVPIGKKVQFARMAGVEIDGHLITEENFILLQLN